MGLAIAAGSILQAIVKPARPRLSPSLNALCPGNRAYFFLAAEALTGAAASLVAHHLLLLSDLASVFHPAHKMPSAMNSNFALLNKS